MKTPNPMLQFSLSEAIPINLACTCDGFRYALPSYALTATLEGAQRTWTLAQGRAVQLSHYKVGPSLHSTCSRSIKSGPIAERLWNLIITASLRPLKQTLEFKPTGVPLRRYCYTPFLSSLNLPIGSAALLQQVVVFFSIALGHRRSPCFVDGRLACRKKNREFSLGSKYSFLFPSGIPASREFRPIQQVHR
ncbi:hypothetical protein ABIB95_000837 [Bradyrhizobium sp. LA2.1]